MVMLGLNRSPLADRPDVVAVTRRGVDWLLSMQNRDGGWAAYDIDIDNQVLTNQPTRSCFDPQPARTSPADRRDSSWRRLLPRAADAPGFSPGGRHSAQQ